MTIELTRHLTEFGYTLFPVASLVGLGFIVKLFIKDRLSGTAYKTLIALFLVIFAAGERVGWFALARALGPVTDNCTNECIIHHPIMWEFKYLMALQTGLMYVIGVMLFIHIFEPYTKLRFFSTIIFIFGTAIIAAII